MSLRAAGVICLRSDGRVLLLRHLPQGHWGLPKGHLDAGEGDLAGALRELAEEVGPAPVELIEGQRWENRYRVPAELGREAADKVVVLFLGRWPEGAAVCLSEEHDAFEWADVTGVEERISFPELRRIIREAQDLALEL